VCREQASLHTVSGGVEQVGYRPHSLKRTRLRALGLGLAVMLLTIKASSASAPLTVLEVRGSSMEPTLHCAHGPGCKSLEPSWVAVLPRQTQAGEIRRGDIVVLELRRERKSCGNGRLYVKRILGVPGDRFFEARSSDDKFRLRASTRRGPSRGSHRLGDGQYYVVGDNLRLSCDSRHFGPVSGDEIVGLAAVVR